MTITAAEIIRILVTSGITLVIGCFAIRFFVGRTHSRDAETLTTWANEMLRLRSENRELRKASIGLLDRLPSPHIRLCSDCRYSLPEGISPHDCVVQRVVALRQLATRQSAVPVEGKES